MSEPRVEVSIGYTRNLGNFESLRMDVGVSFDKKPDENIDQAFERAYAKIEEKLVQFVLRAEGELGGQ
jgi:hypothetical protein